MTVTCRNCGYIAALRFAVCPRCWAMTIQTCAHCQQTMRGYATSGPQYLCHPEAGMDCYRLVTVHHHTMPCAVCVTEAEQA